MLKVSAGIHIFNLGRFRNIGHVHSTVWRSPYQSEQPRSRTESNLSVRMGWKPPRCVNNCASCQSRRDPPANKEVSGDEEACPDCQDKGGVTDSWRRKWALRIPSPISSEMQYQTSGPSLGPPLSRQAIARSPRGSESTTKVSPMPITKATNTDASSEFSAGDQTVRERTPASASILFSGALAVLEPGS